MLLEQLADATNRPPEFDWDSYYRWYFSRLAGRDVTDFRFWECTGCHAVNIIYLPASHGRCRSCGLIHLPESC